MSLLGGGCSSVSPSLHLEVEPNLGREAGPSWMSQQLHTAPKYRNVLCSHSPLGVSSQTEDEQRGQSVAPQPELGFDPWTLSWAVTSEYFTTIWVSCFCTQILSTSLLLPFILPDIPSQTRCLEKIVQDPPGFTS